MLSKTHLKANWHLNVNKNGNYSSFTSLYLKVVILFSKRKCDTSRGNYFKKNQQFNNERLTSANLA